LRIHRWRVATSIVSVISWMVGFVVMLLGGCITPGVADRLDDPTIGAGKRRSDVYPAWLVLRRTTGWPRGYQVEYEGSFAAAWRGPGAMASGMAWVGNGALNWNPGRPWSRLGARGFMLRLEDTERIECTRLSDRSVGLILRQFDGADVWLWLRGKDCFHLPELLRTYAAQTDG